MSRNKYKNNRKDDPKIQDEKLNRKVDQIKDEVGLDDVTPEEKRMLDEADRSRRELDHPDADTLQERTVDPVPGEKVDDSVDGAMRDRDQLLTSREDFDTDVRHPEEVIDHNRGDVTIPEDDRIVDSSIPERDIRREPQQVEDEVLRDTRVDYEPEPERKGFPWWWILIPLLLLGIIWAVINQMNKPEQAPKETAPVEDTTTTDGDSTSFLDDFMIF